MPRERWWWPGQGSYPGMARAIRIRLIVVSESHGAGEETTDVSDGEGVYEGRELRIAARTNARTGVNS